MGFNILYLLHERGAAILSDDVIMQIVVAVISAGSAISVAYINVKAYHNRKQEKEDLVTQQKLQTMEKERLSTIINDIYDKIDNLGKSIDHIQKSLHIMNEQNDENKKTIEKLNQLNEINGHYTHELAELVTVIAQALKDNHFDGNITNAIARFRKFESNTIDYTLTNRQNHVS